MKFDKTELIKYSIFLIIIVVILSVFRFCDIKHSEDLKSQILSEFSQMVANQLKDHQESLKKDFYELKIQYDKIIEPVLNMIKIFDELSIYVNKIDNERDRLQKFIEVIYKLFELKENT